GAASRGPPPARAGRERMAGRRDRSRQHTRRLRRAPAQEGEGPRDQQRDRHRPRRRVQARLMRAGIGRRLVLATAVATALGLTAVTMAFNLVLSHRLARDADAVLRTRAQAQVANLTIDRGAVQVREAANDTALERVWVF